VADQRTGHSVGRSQRGSRERRVLLRAVVWLLGLYGVGFAAFVWSLPRPATAPPNGADAIVALTGEGGRLAPAVLLLEQGGGKRLLITGVNQATSKRNLRSLLEEAGEAFDCCADLGFAATDTRGNAAEAAAWAREHDYRRLIVVTNSYHMPRSLAEFAAQMPGIELIPFPVASERDPTPWQSLRRLHAEYAKYLASIAWIALHDLLDGTSA
jgi:uncharacterized SAM-binding protein YcdF (DUF218 family)